MREKLKQEAKEEIDYIRSINGCGEKDRQAWADLISRQDAYIDSLVVDLEKVRSLLQGEINTALLPSEQVRIGNLVAARDIILKHLEPQPKG